MANMPVEEKVFQLKLDVESNGIITKTLQTADTYVDKNIKVTVNTPDAEFEVKKAAAVTATASTTDTTYTSSTETPYAVEIAADATAGAVQVGVKTPGFAAATDIVEVASATAETATKTIYVKEGHLEGSGTASAESDTVTLKAGTASSEGFVIKASAAGGAEVDVAGWLPAGAKADASGNAYYTLDKVNFANTGSADAIDISATAPVIPSGGYLYIKEGYIKESKISLAKLVPDESTIGTDESSDFIYKTVTAYNNDGKLIGGTMGDAKLGEITANDAEATISTVEVTLVDGAFKVTGNAVIDGSASVSVEERGLATTNMTAEGSVSGEATVDATLAKVTVGASVTQNDVIVTPVIAKEDATTVKSGAITKTQPASGIRYVAVSTAEDYEYVTATGTVTEAGYGIAEEGGYSASEALISAGAAASGTYYVPIEAGSHTVEASEVATANATATLSAEPTATAGFDGNLTAGILSAAPAGEYITITADAASKTQGSVSGTVSCTVTEGYIEAAEETKSIAGNVDVDVTPTAKYIRVYDGTIL